MFIHAVAYADFRPQHVRWKLPFRLASWMQSIGSKFDLGFVLDLLHLDDHEFSGQVVTRCPGHKTAHQLRLVRHKLRTWSWITWSLP